MIKKTTKDLVLNRYHTITPDLLWTSDITLVGKAQCLAILDIATRKVLAFAFKITKSSSGRTIANFSSRECIDIAAYAMEKHNVPSIFHADRALCYTGSEFKRFLELQGIQQSTDDKVLVRFGNQVSERFNRTIKGLAKKSISHYLSLDDRASKKALNKTNAIPDNDYIALLNQCVHTYNSHAHSLLLGETPSEMEGALLHAELNQIRRDIPLEQTNTETTSQGLTFEASLRSQGTTDILEPLKPLLAITGSEDAKLIRQLRERAVIEYNEHWEAFTKALVNQFLLAFKSLEGTVSASKDEVISTLSLQLKEYQLEIVQYKQVVEKQAQDIQFLVAKEAQREVELEKAKAKREARKNRKRRAINDAACHPEFTAAIDVVNQLEYRSEFARHRDIVSLLLLYLTGMRIGELEYCTVANLEALLTPGELELIVKKATNKRRTVDIDEACCRLAHCFKDSIEALQLNKDAQQLVITAQGKLKPLSRTWNNGRINKILVLVSKRLKKTIRANSFRIGHITLMAQVFGLETASKLVGHSRVDTTQIYTRSHLPVHTRKKLSSEVFQQKQKKLPRYYKPRTSPHTSPGETVTENPIDSKFGPT